VEDFYNEKRERENERLMDKKAALKATGYFLTIIGAIFGLPFFFESLMWLLENHGDLLKFIFCTLGAVVLWMFLYFLSMVDEDFKKQKKGRYDR
jgi:glycopeptide antibiotics resistance protein